ncbi:hypothetical protein ONZ45_g8898 [Pleurotus djamor]|nr:hypothetical protein ONZ45_g8898 [Pleurotus djamor]
MNVDFAKHVQVLIVGGGPGGTYAASALAREGLEVAVFEAAKFPRYHIGESLIPSARHYLRFIGAEDKLASYGFTRKPGSAIKFNQNKHEGYTDFVALGHHNNAWNVVRSEFDHMLMNHARSSGARVYEQTRVVDVKFEHSDPSKPTSVTWTHTPPPAPLSPPSSPKIGFRKLLTETVGKEENPSVVHGETSFDYLIDASGRAGIISTRYLKNRRFNEALRNIAVWGYWKNVAFIDPFFSSGIHLAMTSALSAAASICASIRGDCSELEAGRWHTKRVATSYTRFQVVVLSAYKQIRAQDISILSDIDEDNYDRAFAYLRPVIQGASEMGARLSEYELQRSLDFCVQLFNPTTPEQHARLTEEGGELGKKLTDVSHPVMEPGVLEELVKSFKKAEEEEASSDSDSDVELVANKVNARRVVQAEYSINNLEAEPLGGFAVRLDRGKLGLVRRI